MITRTAKLSTRAIRLVPAVMCLFAGCTCSSKLWSNPTPSPTVAAAPSPTKTALPPTPTSASQVAPTEAAPTNLPDAVDPRRAVCERYVAVLSGRNKDAAAIDNPEVKALAMEAPDLVVCGAVATDSDELCTQFLPPEHGPSMKCRYSRAIFHELRAYPHGNSFLISDVDLEEMAPLMTAAVWDTFRQAVRSGDSGQCTQTGDLESMCRAYLSLDTSLCRVTGKTGEVEITFPKGEGKGKLSTVLENKCKREIADRAFLAKGLKDIAESGPASERVYAKAALGQTDACAPYAQAAMDACMRRSKGK